MINYDVGEADSPGDSDSSDLFPRRLRYSEEVLPLHFCAAPAASTAAGGSTSTSRCVRPLKVYARVKPADVSPPCAASCPTTDEGAVNAAGLAAAGAVDAEVAADGASRAATGEGTAREGTTVPPAAAATAARSGTAPAAVAAAQAAAAAGGVPSEPPLLQVTATEVVQRTRAGGSEAYSFSGVFQGSGQEELFNAAIAPLVDDLVSLRVGSSVFMAYGASGTGKSYTMAGTAAQPGMVPRALEATYELLRGRGVEHQVQLSYYEVYENRVYDLLQSARAGRRQAQALPIQVVGATCCIPGLLRCHCADAEVGSRLYGAASRIRTQAATATNSESSRSHAVFTIQVLEVEAGALTGRSATLSLVDLAGAERADRTKHAGSKLRESAGINASLSVLGRCMEALRHNQALAARAAAAAAAGGTGAAGGGGVPRVIPVRESSLTNLFKGVLQGHGNLVMSVHVSQHPDEYDTNRHTLRFAALASRVQVAAAAPALPPPAPQQPGVGRANGARGSSRPMPHQGNKRPVGASARAGAGAGGVSSRPEAKPQRGVPLAGIPEDTDAASDAGTEAAAMPAATGIATGLEAGPAMKRVDGGDAEQQGGAMEEDAEAADDAGAEAEEGLAEDQAEEDGLPDQEDGHQEGGEEGQEMEEDEEGVAAPPSLVEQLRAQVQQLQHRLEGAESKARAARSHAAEWELLAAGRAAAAAEARQRTEELEGRLGEALRELGAERAAREALERRLAALEAAVTVGATAARAVAPAGGGVAGEGGCGGGSAHGASSGDGRGTAEGGAGSGRARRRPLAETQQQAGAGAETGTGSGGSGAGQGAKTAAKARQATARGGKGKRGRAERGEEDEAAGEVEVEVEVEEGGCTHPTTDGATPVAARTRRKRRHVAVQGD